VVKFVKQENDVSHTFFQCSNAFTSSIFIELFDVSSSEVLIAPLSFTKSPKTIPQSTTQLSPQPSNLVRSIQFVVSCFHAMVWPRHTSNDLRNLDHGKIPFQKVQFLSIIFYEDVLFKLPSVLPTIHKPLQM